MGPVLELLPFTQFQISLNKWTASDCVYWNTAEKKFVPTPKGSAKYILLNSWVHIGAFLSIYRMYGILTEDAAHGGGILKNIPSVAVFHVITMWILLGMRVIWKCEPAASLMNTMIAYELAQGDPGNLDHPISGIGYLIQVFKHPMKEHRRFIKLCKEDFGKKQPFRLASAIAQISIFSTPFGVLLFLLTNHCALPVFLTSASADCPVRGGLVLPFPIVLLALTDGVMMYHGITVPVYSIGIMWYYCVLGVLHSLHGVAKVGRGPLTDPFGAVRKYRQLQICATLVNNYNSSGVIPFVIYNILTESIICLYALIALHSTLSPSLIFLLSLIFFDTFVITQMIVYSAASEMHTASNDAIDALRRAPAMRGKVWLRREVKALKCVKSKIGTSGNYFEAGTPLVIQQMTMDNLVSLLVGTA